MVPDLRALRQFLAVADALSFRRAAEQLHMSQPPLSVAIRHLEQTMGVQLFVRSTTGVTLTPAGAVLRSEASRLMAQASQAIESTQATARGDRGAVSVAFITSAMIGFLPPVLTAFGRANPQIRLKLVEAVSVDVAELISLGQVDIGLLSPPVTLAADVVSRQIIKDKFIAVLPADHRLASKAAIPLQALAGERFVSFSADRVPSFHHRIVGACLEAGFQPNIVQEAAHVYTIMALVAGGLGVALLPAITSEMGHRGVVRLPITGKSKLLQTSIDVVYRGGELSPAGNRFLNAIVNQK